MATGATGGGAGGGYGLSAWIAGGAVVVGLAVGAMYYAGLIGPTVSDAPVTGVPDDVQPKSTTKAPPTTADGATQDDATQDDTAIAQAAPKPVQSDPAQPKPVQSDPAQPEPAQSDPTQPEPAQSEPSLSAPGFDVVRVDPDGNAVIAGTGPAGARVTIFLDDQEQVSTIIDRSGAFVSLLSIAPSQSARILTMTAELDGQTRRSDDQIILAPTPDTKPDPVDDVQVAAVDPAQSTMTKDVTEEPAEAAETMEAVATPSVPPTEGAEPDGVAAATEPEPVKPEPTRIEPAQNDDPTALTDGSEGRVVQMAQGEPVQDQPATQPATAVATPKTTIAQSGAQSGAQADEQSGAQSEPQSAESKLATQPVATNQPAKADASAAAVATAVSTGQSGATQNVEVVAANQPAPQDGHSEPSTLPATANPTPTAEGVADDQTPAAPPVKTEPELPDSADIEVASVTTSVAAPTEASETTSGAPSDVVALADPVAAPDPKAAQITETPSKTPTETPAKTPPAVQAIETAALAEPIRAEPIGETPVTIAAQPPTPAPQDKANTAVPELAPAPVQPQVPGQPSIQSQPQSPTQSHQSKGLVTILRAGPDGVEVLQSGATKPQTPDKIALDLISYSEAGEIQLSGRAQVRSVVRVYLDNIPMGDLVTDDTGRWSGEVEGIIPGIYTLRLDELGQAGVVLSRIETPFKRESPDVLRPPQNPNSVATGNTADGGPVPPIRAITVQQGDTLWAISRARYGDGVLYVRVFEANRGDIRDPDLIYPGQVFALPE